MIRSQFWLKTGFLLHVVETYDVCEPHLQGFRMLGDQDETQTGIVSMGTNHLLRGLVPPKLKMM